MSSDNWQQCCAVTLDFEGGNDDDPRDPGGRTSRGITQREYDVWRKTHTAPNGSPLPSDVWTAPQQTIVDIYEQEYWDKCGGPACPAGVDLVFYDAAVNSGLGASLRWARGALAQAAGSFASLALAATAASDRVAVIQRYQAARLSFLHALRTWAYFGRGWASRVAGIEAIATRMAVASQGRPPAPVLADEAKVAANKSKAAGGAAPVAAGPSVAHVSTAVHSTPWDYLITGAVLLITTVTVVYLLHICYVHWVRSKAFAAESSK